MRGEFKVSQKEMLSIRIPAEMNRALTDKLKPVGLSKCQYILQLIGRDLGMLESDCQEKEKTV